MADGGLLEAMEDDVDPSDSLAIVYTSGSTAAPKGVVHTHASLLEHQKVLNDVRGLTADDRLFCNSPFFWIGGIAFAVLASLLAGATLICSNAVDPGETLDLLEAEKPTMTNGFVAGIGHLTRDSSLPRRDLSSMRRGNLYPIMAPDVRPADPELRHTMLGMTEAGSVITISADESDQPEHRRGSFGRPAPGFETKVDDNGELCIRGPFVMQRYYKRSREECFDADGWFRTGDLVRVDRDGFVYFVGRLGAMIKTAGANVAPAEVERAIAKATGLTAYVIGIADARARATGSGRHRHRWPHRPVVAARTSSRRSCRRTRSPSASSPFPRHGSPCSPAARSTCIGSRRCSMTESPATIDALVRQRAALHPDKPMVIDPVERVTFAELDASTHAMAASFLAAGVTKGSRVGLIMPNGVRWVQTALALTRDRRRPCAVEHAVGTARTRRTTAGRIRAVPGRRRGVPRPSDITTTSRRNARICLRCARCGPRTSSPKPQPMSTPSPRRSPPPTPLSSCSPREAAGRRRASSTHTATRSARCSPALRPAASTPIPASICRCRSSGSAASAAASFRHCSQAQRWSPSRYRSRKPPSACSSANR